MALRAFLVLLSSTCLWLGQAQGQSITKDCGSWSSANLGSFVFNEASECLLGCSGPDASLAETTFPAEISQTTIDSGFCTNGAFLLLAGPSQPMSGSIPASLGSVGFTLQVRISSNNLTGPIPEAVQKNPNIVTFEAEGNRLSGSIGDSVKDWHDGIGKLKIMNNAFSGTFERQERINFLKTARSLQEFSLSLNSDTNGCLDVNDIQKARRQAGLETINKVTVPRYCSGKPTPSPTDSPTLPPATLPPVPRPPTGAPSKSPSGPTAAPVPRPTNAPSRRPTDAPVPSNTPKPTAPTPRTLAPGSGALVAPSTLLAVASLSWAAARLAVE